MDIAILLFRTIFIYFVVFLTMRIMGKREIGKLSVFDLVISIMIAEIAVFVLEDVHKPMLEGLVPMVTLVVVQIIIAWISLKNESVRRWFEGKESVIIRNGRLDREEMKKQRYNLDDLMLQLRENKVMNVADVEFALLEPSGKLTVVEKPQTLGKDPPAKGGQERFHYMGLPLPLIMDGKVQEDNLKQLGKTRFWLKRQLQEQGVNDVKEIFFCSIDNRGRWYINRK